MSSTYHIYFQEKVLFKNLNLDEFTLIWNKLYTSYWKEDITYAECIDELAYKWFSYGAFLLIWRVKKNFALVRLSLRIATYGLILHLMLMKRKLEESVRY